MQTAGTPKRPKNVPFGARWVAPLWHYGTVDERGVAQGLWCGWRKNGALAFVAMLANDAVEGPSIEFHPDGGIARRATHHAGAVVGIEEFFAPTKKSDEPFPAAKPIARVVVDHRAKIATKSSFFLPNGAACNEHGTPLSALVHDAPFFVRECETFLKSGLRGYVKHRNEVAPSPTGKLKSTAQPALARDLGALWGLRPRGSLKTALAMLERAKLPKHLGMLRTESIAAIAGQMAAATASSIIARGQRSGSALPIVAMLTGLVPFGSGANGEIFTLAVHDDDESPVYSFTSKRAESAHDLFAMSDDFAIFVTWCAAREAAATGLLSARGCAHVTKLLAHHVHGSELGEAHFAPAAFGDRETKAQVRHRRSAWLAALLSGAPVDIVLRCFEQEEAAPFDRALATRLDRPAALEPPDFVYGLLRSVIAEDPRLPALVEAGEKNRSMLVVSTAELARSLARGQNRLGSVKEFVALRRATQRALFGR